MNINWNNQLHVQKLIEVFSLRLLKISSITSDSIGIKKAFCELERICEEVDFYYDYQANGMIMRITNNPINFNFNCKLALICHIDTVEYDISKWSHNPLGEIKDGRILGRGIIDDKGAKYGCNIFGPRFALGDDEKDLCHCDDESRLICDLMKFYKMLCIFMKDFLS